MCVAKLRSTVVVPARQFFIFIFLGSLKPSVKNNKLSITFIPVIILFVNFNTASEVFILVSTITSFTSSLFKSYCSIASLVPVTNIVCYFFHLIYYLHI